MNGVAKIADIVRKRNGYKFPPLGRLAFNLVTNNLNSLDTEIVPGIHVTIDSWDETKRATWWQGSRFEKPTPQILEMWGQESDVFFDIGANYGFFSYWMLHRCPKISVYSFEPNPTNYQFQETVKGENNLTRLHPFQLGLSDAVAKLTLHVTKEDSGHSSFGINPSVLNPMDVEVATIPFDRWRESNGLALPDKPRWLAKIDVEGFEYKVLSGMKEALTATAFRGIVVEVLDHSLRFCGSSAESVISFLEQYDYVPFENMAASREFELRRTANRFFLPRALAKDK